jgi:hypothetical protein
MAPQRDRRKREATIYGRYGVLPSRWAEIAERPGEWSNPRPVATTQTGRLGETSPDEGMHKFPMSEVTVRGLPTMRP